MNASVRISITNKSHLLQGELCQGFGVDLTPVSRALKTAFLLSSKCNDPFIFL
jgi:hypothetical protein